LPIVVLVCNPAALWIVGRWAIFRPFPSTRPEPPKLPRGFDVVMAPGDDWGAADASGQRDLSTSADLGDADGRQH
jgi:hypothetical protein